MGDTGQVKHVDTGLCLSAPTLANGTDLVLAACSASAPGQVFKPACEDDVRVRRDGQPPAGAFERGCGPAPAGHDGLPDAHG